MITRAWKYGHRETTTMVFDTEAGTREMEGDPSTREPFSGMGCYACEWASHCDGKAGDVVVVSVLQDGGDVPVHRKVVFAQTLFGLRSAFCAIVSTEDAETVLENARKQARGETDA